jgi:type II secretory ATPase GspE/PulE/Tfp pilus assembly ATPase PilB-like protein
MRREYPSIMQPTPETSPAMRALDHYLDLAVAHGASDVHLEPDPAGFATHDVDRGSRVAALRVRLRVDGRLRDVEPPPPHLTSPLLTRLRLLARVDLSESRLPQDGRFTFTRDGRRIDVRAGFMPVEGGEKIALRLLDRGGEGLTLAGLGLTPDARRAFEGAIEAANGLVIVAGPTGSGKTTTLYAAIAHLCREDLSILTVEDPVERKLAGISQVNIDEDCGRTFPVVLRAVLRQDPDILLVGEIRDPESARIACRSALTGHLVLTTLHSSDASEALVRMEEMGLPAYLVRGTVTLIVAQRLVRRLCGACKTERAVLPHEPEVFMQSGLATPGKLPAARGCARCDMQGYRGRLAVFEVHDVRAETGGSPRVTSTTLLHHGLREVVGGKTTLEEVLAECPATRR